MRLCDRTALILDIFSQRAATREGMLQVSCLLQAGLLSRLGLAVAADGTCMSRLQLSWLLQAGPAGPQNTDCLKAAVLQAGRVC